MFLTKLKIAAVLLMLGPLATTRAADEDRAESPLPAGALARLGTSRFHHANILRGLAFSPDGKTIASGSQKGTIRLWDADTGRELRVLAGQPTVVSLAFSPDGKTLASGSWDKSIRLWDVASGKQLVAIAGHEKGVDSLAFSPDGKTLLSASGDHTARLWDAATGAALLQFQGHDDEVCAAVFSRDGKFVATASADKTVRLWEAATAKEVRKFEGHTSRVRGVAFSPDGKRLLSGGWDTTARLWDVGSGKMVASLKHVSGLENVAFSSDGKTVAVAAGWDDSVHVWDVTGDAGRPLWKGKVGQPFGLAFSPDGKRLAASGWDSTVHLWDVATGKEQGAAGEVAHSGWVHSAAFLPDRKTLITADGAGHVILWDEAKGKALRQVEVPARRVWCLAVSADGKHFATGRHDGTLLMWDTAAGKQVGTIKTDGSVKGLAFSPDGRQLAAVSSEGGEGSVNPVPGQGAGVWEVGTGKSLFRLEGHDGGVRTVAYAPDGKTLATGGADGTVRLWDGATGKELKKLDSHAGAVESVAFSPDGKLLASYGQNNNNQYAQAGVVRLWRLGTDDKPVQLGTPAGLPGAVAFSPDSRTLVTAARGAGQLKEALRLWDVATGKERARFPGNQETAASVAFSGDGRVLASGGGDGTVLLWDVTGRVQNGKFVAADLAGPALESAWTNLVGDDVMKAHRAVWELASAPKESLPLLRGSLKPAAPADVKRIAQLVKDLDADDFDAREKATAELEKIGEAAAPALRKALEGTPTAEIRIRAGRLLDQFGGKVASADILRRERALEVLEHIGGAEAKTILEEMAKGAPDAALTQEAKAALKRLAR